MATEALTLKDFLEEFGESLKEKVLEDLKPLFNPADHDEEDRERAKKLETLKRKLFPAQEKAALALAKGFGNGKKALAITAEMGCGKTIISLATAYLIGARRVLVMCPGHLVQKWIREAKETIPGVRTVNLNGRGLKELLDLREDKAETSGMEVWVIGKERAKNHYRVRPGVVTRRDSIHCPRCGEEVEASIEACAKKRLTCTACGEPLYQADNRGFRRYAKAEFIKRHLKGAFDLFIADEVHELKGGDTAQGQALACLAAACKRTLALTGTLMGGYSTNLFYLFWRMLPGYMREKGMDYRKPTLFAQTYGVLERVYRYESRYNDCSIGGTRRLVSTREKPGVSPMILTDFLLENSVFMKLSDISCALPPYHEEVVLVDMLPEQETEYGRLEDDLISEVKSALARGNRRLLGAMVNSLLAYPDGARRGEEVWVEETTPDGEVLPRLVASADAIDAHLLPKEEALLAILDSQISEGRKCLVCLEHTGTRDLIPDLAERIEEAGHKVLVLRSNTTSTEKREEWLKQKMEAEVYDVLITNPRLIQTGLDLLEFPTIIFFQTGYNIFTLRQGSRRSWRIGQDKPVKVYYMAYRGTMQETALTLIASKMETALAVEGDLSDRGLLALAESSSSMVIELARSLVGDRPSVVQGSLEDAWNAYRKRELEADSLLDEKESVEEVVTTSIRKGDREASVTYRTVVRGRVFPRKVKGQPVGVAVIEGRQKKHRLYFVKGKVLYNNKVVGAYEKGEGTINGKPIRLAKAKGRDYYLLLEVRKAG